MPDSGGFGVVGGNGRGLGVNFEKQISRVDQVGPFGEKPLASQLGGLTGDVLKDRVLMNELLRAEGLDIMDVYGPGSDAHNGELDLEVDNAQIAAAHHGRIDNSHLIYAKDRYVDSEPVEIDDSNRTEWFKDFADEVKSLPGADLVKFDNQVGREDKPTDKNAQNLKDAALKAMIRENDEFGLDFEDGAGDGLDIEEDIEKALNKKNEVKSKQLEFKNSKKYPKFEGLTKAERDALELQQKRDELNMDKDMGEVKDIGYRIQNVVDMSKQQGRVVENEEDIIQGEVYGEVDLESGLQLEGELEMQRAVGHGNQSHVKKTHFYTHFDKQEEMVDASEKEIAHAIEFGEDVEVHQFYDPLGSGVKAPPGKVVGNQFDQQMGRGGDRDFLQGKHGLNDGNAVDGDGELELLRQQMCLEEGRVLDLEINPTAKSK